MESVFNKIVMQAQRAGTSWCLHKVCAVSPQALATPRIALGSDLDSKQTRESLKWKVILRCCWEAILAPPRGLSEHPLPLVSEATSAPLP